ncbi:MAG: EFR1 family ferrodoxin, partial [Clostridiales bacterium]|nr:EFR1 family ferrodoxin [Clostridiales bacterium]
MIFYFTATGNSKFIAGRIASETGDKIVNIAECVKTGKFVFELADNEDVGIVSPVYFRGIPIIVSDFLQELRISPKTVYSYAILNCGGKAGDAEKFITRSFKVNAVFDIATVSNYVPVYKAGSVETVRERLDKAELEIGTIVEHIKERHKGVFKNNCEGGFPGLSSDLFYPVYKMGRKTSKFTVNGNCTGCGTCVKVCPRSV